MPNGICSLAKTWWINYTTSTGLTLKFVDIEDGGYGFPQVLSVTDSVNATKPPTQTTTEPPTEIISTSTIIGIVLGSLLVICILFAFILLLIK